VVNGLAGQPAVFGLVPTGTGNDLARMLNLPDDPVAAVQRVLHGTPKRIDLLELNGTRVMNIIGFGFDAAVAHDINTANWKKRAGSLGYIISMLKMMVTFRPFTLRLDLDGQEMVFENCWLVAVGNSKYYGGGMKICPDAELDDGLLDVCVVHNVTRLQLLRLFPTVFSGKHVQLPQVAYKQGRIVRAQTSMPVPIHGDGEILGQTPCDIRVQPQVVSVVY
jgi:diacylglycerol kinase (ATP)